MEEKGWDERLEVRTCRDGQKIQLELAKENEPEQEEQEAVANGDVIYELSQKKYN